MTLTTVSVEELLVRLSDARIETDRLFASLDPAILYDRPIPERHRIIFYIGHLEAFDWNLLRKVLGLTRFHPEFDQLFAFGIDPVDGKGPSDQPEDWPSFTQVDTYRRRLRAELDGALSEATESEELADLLNIAIEHRLMHAETLEYMFHQLPYHTKHGSDEQPAGPAVVPVPETIAIPPGIVNLGLQRNGGQFGWDNEFEAHTVPVPKFSIDKYKVTNRQFLKFVEQGGYQRRSLWEPSDWEWKTQSQITHPVFWVPSQRRVSLPVYVRGSPPLARFAGVCQPRGSIRLCALGRQRSPHGSTVAACGRRRQAAFKRAFSLGPAAGHIALRRRGVFGVEGMFGTGWEWTSTPFGPYAGFAAHPAYPGYSANFFDNKHFVMKGGSTRTAGCMLRPSFRNWFQAHYQYVYAGFRCVNK